MTFDETIFLICNNGVVPFWALLVFAPKWSWTRRLVHSGLFAALLIPVYALMLWSDTPGPQGASFFSLAGVMQIFTTPRTVVACWIHYLIFDLFVGAWEARDAQRRGVPHWLLVPCLVMTLMFGPVGLGMYLAARYWRGRDATLSEV